MRRSVLSTVSLHGVSSMFISRCTHEPVRSSRKWTDVFMFTGTVRIFYSSTVYSEQRRYFIMHIRFIYMIVEDNHTHHTSIHGSYDRCDHFIIACRVLLLYAYKCSFCFIIHYCTVSYWLRILEYVVDFSSTSAENRRVLLLMCWGTTVQCFKGKCGGADVTKW